MRAFRARFTRIIHALAHDLRGGFHSAIGRRLLIAIVAFSSLVTFLLTANELYRAYQADVNAIGNSLDQIRVAQADAISGQLWDLNDEQLQRTLDGLVRLPHIAYLQVTTDDGTSIASGRLPEGDIAERTYALRHSTRGHVVTIGALHVVASLAAARQQLLGRIAFTLFNNGVKTFLVSIFALALIHLIVTRRLSLLGRVCRDYQLHKPVAPPHLPRSGAPGGDELDQVSGAFNAMLARVEKTYAELRASEQRYRCIVETAGEGIWLVDHDDCTTFVNPKLSDMLGYPSEQMVGQNLHQFIDPACDGGILGLPQGSHFGPAGRRELRLRHSSGEPVWVLLSTSPIETERGADAGALAMVTDISQRKEAEARIHKLAYFDPLTQLPNRSFMLKRLSEALHHACRHKHLGALLFLDLDNFKAINDSLGHVAGDGVLSAIGERLSESTREEDTVGRLSGDEFIILLPDLGTERATVAPDCVTVAGKLLRALSRPIETEGRELRVGASLGVCVFEGRESAEEVLRRADTALYKAKAKGRNDFAFYESDMGDAADYRLALEKGLRDTLHDQDLGLAFQPILCVDSGRMVGVEALVRWTHEQYGPVAPESFIAIAEDTGLIHEIGQDVLRKACIAMTQLLSETGPWEDLYVSVNVSPSEILEAGYVERVEQTLADTGLAARHLQLEITEQVAIEQTKRTIPRLQALKELGIALAVDDFGTGYSSLYYLKSLPLRTLKIDRAFVDGMTVDPDDAAIVDAVMAIANHFRLEVTAEGVEHHGQLEALRARGCRSCQGYLFARPMPLDELMRWMQGERRQRM